jgi:hypothetical protein
MRPTNARLLVRLYPRAWRERYGEEFEALLELSDGNVRSAANVFWAAMGEHLSPTQGGKMDHPGMSFATMMKKPTAFIPVAMSLTGLLLVLSQYGAVREADEGATAHLWQLLMAGQMPIIGYFVIAWLGRAPRQALEVIAVQAGAALAAMAPVYFWNL